MKTLAAPVSNCRTGGETSAGVSARTRMRLIEHLGSLRGVREAGLEALGSVVSPATANAIRSYFPPTQAFDPQVSPQ